LYRQFLNCQVDGLAIKTAEGLVVVEVQPDGVSGNFFRDGSVPWRWIFGVGGSLRSSPDAELPRVVVSALFAALDRLPLACCVGWVLDAVDGRTYFVDVTRLDQRFLASLRHTRPKRYSKAVLLP
jgi:hypothetical protein